MNYLMKVLLQYFVNSSQPTKIRLLSSTIRSIRMALSHENTNTVDTLIRKSPDTQLSALLEPPSISAECSNDFDFTPTSKGTCNNSKDGNAEDICSPISIDSTIPDVPLKDFSTAEVQAKIEASKVHWTSKEELVETEAESLEETLIIFKSLQEKYGSFFMDFADQFEMGHLIAEGGQAEIYEVFSSQSNEPVSVVKLFKKDLYATYKINCPKACSGLYHPIEPISINTPIYMVQCCGRGGLHFGCQNIGEICGCLLKSKSKTTPIKSLQFSQIAEFFITWWRLHTECKVCTMMV